MEGGGERREEKIAENAETGEVFVASQTRGGFPMTSRRSIEATRHAAAALVAILIAAMAPAGIAAADEAEAAFKARCAECHGPRDIRHWGRQRPDAAARETWLDQFLRRHYPPSEAERALIVRHVQSTLAGAAR
jgi:mono/diheme cytochrome c family protein